MDSRLSLEAELADLLMDWLWRVLREVQGWTWVWKDGTEGLAEMGVWGEGGRKQQGEKQE